MKHRTIARTMALAASSTLAFGVLSAVAAPAQAAPVITDGYIYSVGSAGNMSGDCAESVPSTSQNQDFVTDSETRSASHSHDATVTNNAAPAEVTTVHSRQSGTARVTAAGGSLRSVDFKVTGEQSMSVPAGQLCDTSLRGETDLYFEFKIARAGWLTIDTTSRGFTYSEAWIERDDSPEQEEQDTWSEFDVFDNTSRVFLPVGEYEFYAEFEARRFASGGSFATKRSAATVSARFVPGGEAPAAAQGGGKAFVDLPVARDCAGNAVTATFKKPAKKVAKATFFVNGKKRKTVNSAKKGKTVKLGSLVDAKPVTVKAVLKLDPPRKGKKGKTKTVTRSYTACSG
ncbi:hypothetical protein [Nocardioides sp. SYSU D00038]|uniref:hypothetical protein n=1 Tax=Nocardioides sp. SYSU D00038 TaxID=2812554 RepID=UPI00196718EC|nr:hypothetical protein [Nocardioides sp. SYSU D00038]